MAKCSTVIYVNAKYLNPSCPYFKCDKGGGYSCLHPVMAELYGNDRRMILGCCDGYLSLDEQLEKVKKFSSFKKLIISMRKEIINAKYE